MTKTELIEKAATLGIDVKEQTCGIYNPYQAYAVRPSDERKRQYMEKAYHVTNDTTRDQLLSGIRIMAELMNVKLPAGFTS